MAVRRLPQPHVLVAKGGYPILGLGGEEVGVMIRRYGQTGKRLGIQALLRELSATEPRVDLAKLASLVDALSSENSAVRRRARAQLVAIGKPAVGPLIRALADRNHRVRWEAAKALSVLHDSEAAPALVRALSDEDVGVEWLASEALVALKRDALEPLLTALTKPLDSAWVSVGTRHALRELAKRRSCKVVLPVLAALDGPEPAVGVPSAAEAALGTLRECGQRN